MIMGQDMDKVERQYDALAKEYAEAFSGEHERKPMDREILQRFSQEIGDRGPVWDLGCGPGQTTKYLNDIGIGAQGQRADFDDLAPHHQIIIDLKFIPASEPDSAPAGAMIAERNISFRDRP